MLSFVSGLVVGVWIGAGLGFVLGTVIRRDRDEGPDYFDY